MNKRAAKDLLKRYQSGKCTQDEQAKLEAWYAAFSAKPLPAWLEDEKDAIAFDLKNGIDEQIRSRKVGFSILQYITVAASLILVSAILLLFKFNSTLFRKDAQVIYKETHAKPGSRVKLTLSDGSTVILNGGSTLRYPKAFEGTRREVSLLEGEAFFDIQHDVKKMFVVNALGTHTYVLGTAFNIRAYKLSKEIQITVIRGKVVVKGLSVAKNDPQSVTLMPDEQITIVKTTGGAAHRHIKAADYTVWIEGKYKFNNETLGNVATVLENSFKVHIKFSRADLKDIRFSSEFNNTDKLEELLFAICKANNLSYKIINSQIILAEEHNQYK